MMRNLHCSTGAMILFVAGLLSPKAGLCQGKLTITTDSLASGTANVAYSQALVATGGNPPYQWSVMSGALARVSR